MKTQKKQSQRILDVCICRSTFAVVFLRRCQPTRRFLTQAQNLALGLAYRG